MAKSLRSKKKKRLRTLRRELAEPLYDKKDAAKLAAQEAALAAPKLAVRTRSGEAPMDATVIASTSMDVEMADGGSSQLQVSKSLLKPGGGIGKKSKKKLKMKNGKRHGKRKGNLWRKRR